MLHTFGQERVSLERWEADVLVEYPPLSGGLELFVLEGTLWGSNTEYPAGTWCRYPVGESPQLRAGKEGAMFYLKRGHLPAA